MVVRDVVGDPVVIRNAPLLDDGTPMPTLYWLVGNDLKREVGTLESTGAVRRAERELAPEDIAAAHDAYRAARDALIPADHDGPRPSGGVGGTRRGVKCLHAHYATYLVDGTDPVGRWVARELDEQRARSDGSTDHATSTNSASRDQAGPAWPATRLTDARWVAHQ